MIGFFKSSLKSFIGYVKVCHFYTFKTSKIKRSDIIFIFPYYHIGGAEQVHLDIVQAIAGKKVTVIFTHLSATDHFLSHFCKSATTIELNSIINKKSNKVRKALFRSIATAINRSNSVTHVFGCNTSYFYNILPLLDSSKQRIDLIHAIAPDDSRIPMLVDAAKYIDKRVVINKKTQSDFIKIYNDAHIQTLAERLFVIQNGVDLTRIKENSKVFSAASLRIGFIGRWSDEKRPWLFLEIAQKLGSELGPVHFKMAGSGMKGYKKTIEKAGVNYRGAITTTVELENFYKEIDVIIICSTTEGFPMVIMEAMPYGVIPICTNVGGISEHITHKSNGLLVDDVQESEIVNTFISYISHLLNDIENRKKLSKNARAYAINNFGIEKCKTSYQKLLQ